MSVSNVNMGELRSSQTSKLALGSLGLVITVTKITTVDGISYPGLADAAVAAGNQGRFYSD